jgi:hypothetical protein
MVDHNHGWRLKLTGFPVCGTSLWWHGEQEKGTGIPTLVGTRRQRGSDDGALVKGGGSGANSMRRWRDRDGGAFYRLGDVVEGTGDVGSPVAGSGD